MLYACDIRFNVTENLEFFCYFLELNKAKATIRDRGDWCFRSVETPSLVLSFRLYCRRLYFFYNNS